MTDSILGSILGAPIYGNHHVEVQLCEHLCAQAVNMNGDFRKAARLSSTSV